MKNLIYIFLLLTSTLLSAQNYSHENRIKLYEYTINNLDKVKNAQTEDILFVKLIYNEENFISQVIYYTCKYNELQKENKKEVKISKEYDLYVKKTLSYFPMSSFPDCSKSGDSSMMFRIPLDVATIKKAIKEVESMIKEEKYKSFEILPNSKFRIETKKMFFNETENKCINVNQKLDNLNSNYIEISPNVFIFFRIIKTSDFDNDNSTINFFEYKILYLNGTESFNLGSFREKTRSKTIKITENPAHHQSDNLEGSIYCDNDITEDYIDSRFENLKFEILITFE